MTELLSVIAQNFWLVLLIITLLLCKGHRITGIVILVSLVCFGFVRWFVILAVVCTVLFEYVRWYTLGAFNQYNKSKGSKPGTGRSRNFSEEEKR